MSKHALQTRTDSAARSGSDRAAVPSPASGAVRPALPAGPYLYGYRPAVTGHELHCVLPGRMVNSVGRRPISWAWCKTAAYLDNGPDCGASWAWWPACTACRRGYEQHLILRLLASAPPYGVSTKQVGKLLTQFDATTHLAQLYRDGVLGGDFGADGAMLYRLASTSATAAAYLEGAR
jgi:hypothetical protein